MAYNYLDFLKQQRDKGYSDSHLICGQAPCYRNVDNRIVQYDAAPLTKEDLNNIIENLLDDDEQEELRKKQHLSIGKDLGDLGRFRVSFFTQVNGYGVVFRQIPLTIPNLEQLEIPNVIVDIMHTTHGILFITGPNNSGKTTILNSLIDEVNQSSQKNIMMLEDPIEFRHSMKKSLVVQRDVGQYAQGYAEAMKNVLRQDVDIVVVGELRDRESMDTVFRLCESGYLVVTTLHTIDAVQTIERIVEMYPPEYQQSIQLQFSLILKGIMCQELLRHKSGEGVVPCREILIPTDGICNLIKEGAIKNIYNQMQIDAEEGNILYDQYLAALYQRGDIDEKIFRSRIHDKTVAEELIA